MKNIWNSLIIIIKEKSPRNFKEKIWSEDYILQRNWHRQKFVFIIDKSIVVRSKNFGELLSLSTHSYRGEKGVLQYANLHKETDEKFYIPSIYIIGTMNDIDRSVNHLWFAIVVVFVLLKLLPGVGMLDKKLLSMQKKQNFVIEIWTLLSKTFRN